MVYGESHLFFVKAPYAFLASAKSGSSTLRSYCKQNLSYSKHVLDKYQRRPAESYPVTHLVIVLRNPKRRFESGLAFSRERNFGASHALDALVPKTNEGWRHLPSLVRIHLAPISLAIEWLLTEVKELKSCKTVEFIPLSSLDKKLTSIGIKPKRVNKGPSTPLYEESEWEKSKHLFESDIRLFETAPFEKSMDFESALSLVQSCNDDLKEGLVVTSKK